MSGPLKTDLVWLTILVAIFVILFAAGSVIARIMGV